MRSTCQDRMRIAGDRVRTRRKQQHLSQTQLGELTGTTYNHISTIEGEKAGASLRTAIGIAEALDTSLDYLVGRVDDSRPAHEIASELKTKSARIRDLEEGHAEPLDPNWQRPCRHRPARHDMVGANGTIREETVVRSPQVPVPVAAEATGSERTRAGSSA